MDAVYVILAIIGVVGLIVAATWAYLTKEQDHGKWKWIVVALSSLAILVVAIIGLAKKGAVKVITVKPHKRGPDYPTGEEQGHTDQKAEDAKKDAEDLRKQGEKLDGEADNLDKEAADLEARANETDRRIAEAENGGGDSSSAAGDRQPDPDDVSRIGDG